MGAVAPKEIKKKEETRPLLLCYKLKLGIAAQGILNELTGDLDGLEAVRQIPKCSKKSHCL